MYRVNKKLNREHSSKYGAFFYDWKKKNKIFFLFLQDTYIVGTH